jgi:hypothetical protein
MKITLPGITTNHPFGHQQEEMKRMTASQEQILRDRGGRAIDVLVPLIMADIGAIGKNHRTTGGAIYNFRSVDDVLNAVQPVLIKHGVSLATKFHDYKSETFDEPKPEKVGGSRKIHKSTLLLDLEFRASDGTSVTFSSAGEGQDYGNSDKATNRAMSAAWKYAMFLGLCIPVEQTQIDDSDRDQIPADASTSPVASSAKAATAALPVAVQPATPAVAEMGNVLGAMVETPNGEQPCTSEQVAWIIKLAGALAIPPDGLKEIVRKRGVEKAAKLTGFQAAEIIAKLEAKLPQGVAVDRASGGIAPF